MRARRRRFQCRRRAPRARDAGPVEAFENARAIRAFARNLAPRHDLDLLARAVAALRREIERTHALDGIAEELDARRQRFARGEDVEDAAAHRVLADRTNDVGAHVAEGKEPFLQTLEPRFVADA